MDNLFIAAENLLALKYLLQVKELGGGVDLVYIDPPFATGGSFVLSESGRAATISKSSGGQLAYSDKFTREAFLAFLGERLLLLRELLSEKGSIYLHIDYKIGHYVKVLMDEIFGSDNFRNDITRIKCNPKNFARVGYGNIKDMILFYTKGKKPIWNEPRDAYSEEDLVRLFPKISAKGRRYTTVPLHAPGETRQGASAKPFRGMSPPEGRHWRSEVETLEQWDAEGIIEWSSSGNPRKIIYADEQVGKRVQDIWEYKDPQYPLYPTEKNAKILDRIISTSSNPDSIVLDCFCGSGTTLLSAQRNGRRWLGVDSSATAKEIVVERLASIQGDLFVLPPKYHIVEAPEVCKALEERESRPLANHS